MVAARCCTFGPAAGTAGVSSWSSAGGMHSSSGARNVNRAGRPVLRSGPSHASGSRGMTFRPAVWGDL